MLHTMFQGHQPFDSGEEDFLRFLPYMGMAAILVKWHAPFEQAFVPPSEKGSTWNLASVGLAVTEEKKFKSRAVRRSDYSPATALYWRERQIRPKINFLDVCNCLPTHTFTPYSTFFFCFSRTNFFFFFCFFDISISVWNSKNLITWKKTHRILSLK